MRVVINGVLKGDYTPITPKTMVGVPVNRGACVLSPRLMSVPGRKLNRIRLVVTVSNFMLSGTHVGLAVVPSYKLLCKFRVYINSHVL